MAWYDTGSVAVTNGSTTVTGTGTNFITGAQVGEAFLAPDDKLYEIASITSATVLVLADSYLGSTQSGQDYKIVPTQSLVADLASDVTDLITDYADVKDKAGAGKFNDGSVTAPGITFEQDQNNGLYRIGSDNYGLSAGGTKQIDISTTDVELNHSGSKKLATTATGVDVTGTVATDYANVYSGVLSEETQLRVGYSSANNWAFGRENATTGDFFIKSTDASVDTTRLKLHNNGDVSFFEDTGTTAKFHWDSSAERLGLGTSNPIRQLHIYESGTGNVGIELDNTQAGEALTIGKQGNSVYGATSVGDSFIYTYDSNITLMSDGGAGNTSSIKFATGGNSERARIDSSGNVGIGTDSPSYRLHVDGADSGSGIAIQDGNDAGSTGLHFLNDSGTVVAEVRGLSDNTGMTFQTNGSERARIDSSGNLLVGTTSLDGSTGCYIGNSGVIEAARSGVVQYLNRTGSNGQIAQFRKDGSTVGSIGSRVGAVSYLVLDPRDSSGGVGIGTTYQSVVPCDHAGANTDGVNDLGVSGNRWKDLYLSGGVYLGGIDAVNKLDDYEEGTFTPVLKGSSTTGTFTAGTNNGGGYVRVGNQVTCWINIGGVLSGAAGNMEVLGLPFNCASRFTTGRKNAAYSTGSLQYWDGVSVQVIAPLSVPATNKIYFHTYGTGNDSTSGASPVVVNGTHNLHCFVTYMID